MALRSSTLRGRVYRFHSDAVDRNVLQVISYEGSDAIGKPYRYDLKLVSEKDDLDSAAILKSAAHLAIKQGIPIAGTDKRGIRTLRVHGTVAEFEQREKTMEWVIYRAVLVPRLWKLSLSRQTRVFLDKTAPEIIEDVLKGAGLAAEDYEIKTDGSYPKLEYILQYGEDDLSFLSRIAEHWGIFYFFQQMEEVEKVIFADSTGAYEPLAGASGITYRPAMRDLGRKGPGEDQPAEDWFGVETISEISCRHTWLPAEVVLKDYNYRQPSVPLEVSATVSPDGFGTVYEYGNHYKTADEGKTLAQVRAEELLCREKAYEGKGVVRNFAAGATFQLQEHYGGDAFNQEYLLTEVWHRGEQSISLHAIAAPMAAYENDFVAVPASLVFRPRRVTPKPKISGTINATVDAAGSEEYAEIDESGRYKVTMPFDRSGKSGGKASRYVRMAQPYSGAEFGMHFPLHKGAEVMLVHTGGDPDRPVIVGTVPNPEQTSPVTGNNHTQCVIKTGSQNQIVFEDQKGTERIKLSTPMLNTYLSLGAPNDDGNVHMHTDGNSIYETVGDETTDVDGDRDDNVAGDAYEETGGNWTKYVHGSVEWGFDCEYKIQIGKWKEELIVGAKTQQIGGLKSVVIVGAKHESVIGGIVKSTMGIETSYAKGWKYSQSSTGLQELNPTAKEKADTKEREYKDLQDKVENHTACVDLLQMQIEINEQEIDQLTQTVKTAEVEIDNLQEFVGEYAAEVDDLTVTVNNSYNVAKSALTLAMETNIELANSGSSIVISSSNVTVHGTVLIINK